MVVISYLFTCISLWEDNLAPLDCPLLQVPCIVDQATTLAALLVATLSVVAYESGLPGCLLISYLGSSDRSSRPHGVIPGNPQVGDPMPLY